jgi:cytochrome c oxidase subunit 4
MTQHAHDPNAIHDPREHLHVHVVPPKVLLTVFGILLVLTVLTVAVTKIDLGKLNIWIAMGIALVKAAVVSLYFMHLRYDRPVHAGFVVLFIGSVLIDTKEYQPNLLGRPAPVETP